MSPFLADILVRDARYGNIQAHGNVESHRKGFAFPPIRTLYRASGLSVLAPIKPIDGTNRVDVAF